MQKRVWIFSLCTFLLTIGFVSAQGLFGDYFSFSSFLSSFDPTLITLSLLFIIFFAVLFFSTSRIFKENRAIAAVISVCISLLAVYWINESVNVGNFISNLGISNDLLYTILPFAVIGAVILFANIKSKNGNKLGFGGVFLILGIILVILSFIPGLIYEGGVSAIIGIAFIILGIFLLVRRKKKGYRNPPRIRPGHHTNNYNTYNTYNELERERKQEQQEKEKVKEEEAEESHEREKVKEEENEEQGEKERRKEVLALENKAKADENLAREKEQQDVRAEQQERQKERLMIGQERGAEQQERQIIVREKGTEQQELVRLEQEKREEQQINQTEKGLISTDVKSLHDSYIALYNNFNELERTSAEISKQDPNDPRLGDLSNSISQVRRDLIQIREAYEAAQAKLQREKQRGG